MCEREERGREENIACLLGCSPEIVALTTTKKSSTGISLVVQWLGLRALTAKGPSSILDWGIKISQAMQHGQKTTNYITVYLEVQLWDKLRGHWSSNCHASGN